MFCKFHHVLVVCSNVKLEWVLLLMILSSHQLENFVYLRGNCYEHNLNLVLLQILKLLLLSKKRNCIIIKLFKKKLIIILTIHLIIIVILCILKWSFNNNRNLWPTPSMWWVKVRCQCGSFNSWPTSLRTRLRFRLFRVLSSYSCRNNSSRIILFFLIRI